VLDFPDSFCELGNVARSAAMEWPDRLDVQLQPLDVVVSRNRVRR
jgi:hypothetical protein